jgi:hypothetical protein
MRIWLVGLGFLSLSLSLSLSVELRTRKPVGEATPWASADLFDPSRWGEGDGPNMSKARRLGDSRSFRGKSSRGSF